jgi:hypothetical protein
VVSASCVSSTTIFPAQFSLPISRTVLHRDSCNRHAANTLKWPHVVDVWVRCNVCHL